MPYSRKGNKNNKKIDVRKLGTKNKGVYKRKKRVWVKPNKHLKGYWRYCDNQKIYNSNEQGQILKDLESARFDNDLVRRDAYNEQSIVDIVIEKHNSKKKLDKREKIILDNYLDTHKKKIAKDLESLERSGIKAKDIKTKEVRMRQLFMILKKIFSGKSINNDLVFKIYCKFRNDKFDVSDDILKEFGNEYTLMNNIVSELKNSRVGLQFTKFYNEMPPLNNKGFKHLEPFQKETVINIDNGISTIVSAPTSAGKTWLMGYIFAKHKCRILVCVPTDPLAFQLCGYIQNITNEEATLVTEDWKSHPNPDELYKKLSSNRVIVGTPKELFNILTFKSYDQTIEGNEKSDLEDLYNFDYVIFDEIHLIGDEMCKSVEALIKRFSDSIILGLSATIPNAEQFLGWLKTVGYENSRIVSCTKRFFNSRVYNYNSINDTMEHIHPLSMLSLDSFISGEVLNMDISPTPPDIWDLVVKLKNKLDLGELCPFNTFIDENDKVQMIELDQTISYFKEIIKFMVLCCTDDRIDIIKTVLSSYAINKINHNNVDLLKLITNMKSPDTDDGHVKLPALVFNKNRQIVLKLARECARQIITTENEKYPNRQEELYKKNLKIARSNKKKENGVVTLKSVKYEDNKPQKVTKGTDGNVNNSLVPKRKKTKTKKIKGSTLTDKQRIKENQKGNNVEEEFDVDDFLRPESEFIFNEKGVQNFSTYEVKNWIDKFSTGYNKFFPNNGSNCHYMVDLLQRGIGIYVKGLPASYLREVHKLTSQKKLQLVFTDTELIFGISLPIRTFVFVNDPRVVDDLDTMMAKQGSGRAGRRGLDTMAYQVFCNYSPERVKQLLISPIPEVRGQDTKFYAFENMMLNVRDDKWTRVKTNFLLNTITNERAKEFYEGIKGIQETSIEDNGWSFSIRNDWAFNYMCSQLGYSMQCFRIAYILDHIRKIFCNCDPVAEKNQLNLFYILLHFVNICKVEDKCLPEDEDFKNDHVLEELLNGFVVLGLTQDIPEDIITNSSNDYQISLEQFRKNVDGSLFFHYRENRIQFSENTINIREKLDKFYKTMMVIQNYFYDKKEIVVTRLFGKALSRIFYMLQSSNPAIRPLNLTSYLVNHKDYSDSDNSDETNEADDVQLSIEINELEI
jgi:hypothetical protein